MKISRHSTPAANSRLNSALHAALHKTYRHTEKILPSSTAAKQPTKSSHQIRKSIPKDRKVTLQIITERTLDLAATATAAKPPRPQSYPVPSRWADNLRIGRQGCVRKGEVMRLDRAKLKLMVQGKEQGVEVKNSMQQAMTCIGSMAGNSVQT